MHVVPAPCVIDVSDYAHVQTCMCVCVCAPPTTPYPQVLRYGPSNKYGAHMDGLGRVASVLIYLVGEDWTRTDTDTHTHTHVHKYIQNPVIHTLRCAY